MSAATTTTPPSRSRRCLLALVAWGVAVGVGVFAVGRGDMQLAAISGAVVVPLAGFLSSTCHYSDIVDLGNRLTALVDAYIHDAGPQK